MNDKCFRGGNEAPSSGTPGQILNLRFRMRNDVATELMKMPVRARNRVVAMVLASHLARLNLHHLLEVRDELRRLGVNLNQIARFTNVDRGLNSDLGSRLTLLVKKIEELTGGD